MTSIGIRALRQDMAGVIARVTNGETITLTDYRHTVARIVPVASHDRYSITNAHGLTALYCTPCGAIIGNVCGPVSDLLATIGTHDATTHQGDDQ